MAYNPNNMNCTYESVSRAYNPQQAVQLIEELRKGRKQIKRLCTVLERLVEQMEEYYNPFPNLIPDYRSRRRRHK